MEAMAGAEVFLTFVLSFVCMIVPPGREMGMSMEERRTCAKEGDMHGRGNIRESEQIRYSQPSGPSVFGVGRDVLRLIVRLF